MQAPPGPPVVVAIIPCHRGRPAGVEALRAQDHPVDILVLSNGPAGPRAVAGAVLRRVAWEGHGDTRLRAVRAAEFASFVLFLSDDATPAGPGVVSALLAAAAETGADAVVARQVPRPGADPVTCARLAAWTPPGDGRPRPFPQADHVCTLWRRAALLDAAASGVPIGEDLVWSHGRRVVLAPDAAVIHSHPRGVRGVWAREAALHAVRARVGLPPTVPGPAALLRALPAAARAALRHGPTEGLCLATEAAAQWWGARAGARYAPWQEPR